MHELGGAAAAPLAWAELLVPAEQLLVPLQALAAHCLCPCHSHPAGSRHGQSGGSVHVKLEAINKRVA